MATETETDMDPVEFGKKLGADFVQKKRQKYKLKKNKDRIDTDSSGDLIQENEIEPTHWKWSEWKMVSDSDHFMSLIQQVADDQAKPLFGEKVELVKNPENGDITANYFTEKNCPHLSPESRHYFNQVLADTCRKVYYEGTDRDVFRDGETNATYTMPDDRAYKITWDEFLHNIRTAPDQAEYINDEAIYQLLGQDNEKICKDILDAHNTYRKSRIHKVVKGLSPYTAFAERVAEHNAKLDPTTIGMSETYGTRYSNFSSVLKYKGGNYYHVPTFVKRFKHSRRGQDDSDAFLHGTPTYYWKMDIEPFKVSFPYVQVRPENSASCTGGVLLYQDPEHLDNACMISFDRNPGMNRTTGINIDGQLPYYDSNANISLEIPLSLSSDIFKPQTKVEFRRNANNQIVSLLHAKIDGHFHKLPAAQIEDMFGDCLSYSSWKNRLARGDIMIDFDPNGDLAKKYGISVANGKVTVKNDADLERLHQAYVHIKHLERDKKVQINGKPEKIFVGSDHYRSSSHNNNPNNQQQKPAVLNGIPGAKPGVLPGDPAAKAGVTSSVPVEHPPLTDDPNAQIGNNTSSKVEVIIEEEKIPVNSQVVIQESYPTNSVKPSPTPHNSQETTPKNHLSPNMHTPDNHSDNEQTPHDSQETVSENQSLYNTTSNTTLPYPDAQLSQRTKNDHQNQPPQHQSILNKYRPPNSSKMSKNNGMSIYDN